jgi:guanine nucleotide-binding protein G(i) subunit alpha
MKIIHQDGFSIEELLSYRPIIYKNVLDSAQAIVLAMRKLGVACILPANAVSLVGFFSLSGNVLMRLIVMQPNTERIMEYKVDSTPSFIFSEEIAEAIHQLWQDPIIRKVMDHTSEFYLMDSAT